MKKSIPKVRERESEASILGNDREREFPLTPGPGLQPWKSFTPLIVWEVKLDLIQLGF